MENNFDFRVESATYYLSIISDIRKQIIEQEGILVDSRRLFFRGQENSTWDLRPSVFRDGLLPMESSAARTAYSRNPNEFRSLSKPFERLTKLQHYGLCTRLLDVTLNPLVALYFACLPCFDIIDSDGNPCELEQLEGRKVFPDGVVYYQRAYSYGIDDLEIRILSYLAEMDFDKPLSLKVIVDRLHDTGGFLKSEIENLRSNEYRILRKILQGNYFVLSNFTNERLSRQNGAFLLPGSFNITISESSIGSSIVQKATASMKGEFEATPFIIPFDKKEEILDELDFYNINEASLFPELEHQMRYVKTEHGKHVNPSGVSLFVKSEYRSEEPTSAYDMNTPIEFRKTNEEVLALATKIARQMLGINNNAIDEIVKVIKNNLVVDWYRKTTVVSKMKVEIARLVSTQDKFTPKGSTKFAESFMRQFCSLLEITAD